MLSKLLAMSAAAGMVLLLAAPAVADPSQEVLQIDCDGTTLLMAVAPANGTFTPNFDASSTSVFKPTQITVTKQVFDADRPVGSLDVTTSVLGQGKESQGKQAQRRESVVCEGSETLPGEWVGLPPGQSLVVSMTATGFFTPLR